MIYLNLFFIPVNSFLVGKTTGWVRGINALAVVLNLIVLTNNIK